MKTKLYIQSLIILILTLSINLCSAQKNDWELRKIENDIIVHTRENIKTGNIEFKASIVLETSIDSLIQIFNDIKNYPQWMADVETATLLKKKNNNEQYIYLKIQTPWPLKNRDLPFLQTILTTDNITTITLIGKPNYIPNRKDIVRVNHAVGTWEFIKLSNNRIKVNYQFMADPGLDIPNWVIDAFIVDGPIKTLNNLRELTLLNK